MTRSTWYFLCLFALVGGSLLLRILSPSLSKVDPLQTSASVDQEPHDYVTHPWVAPGEESHGPKRIISIAPSITEAICALGLRDRLVGRTQYCQYPPSIKKVPIIGGLTDTNYEKIKSLNPEVVFVTENSYEVIRTLRAINVHVEEIPHETLEDIYIGIARLGILCERPETARVLVWSILTDIDSMRRYASAHLHRETRVLMPLEMRVPPQALMVAGPGTFLDTLLHLAGYTNAVQDAKQTYWEASLEPLVKMNPDVILDFGAIRKPAQTAELYSSWEQIPGLSAIQNRRVVQIGGQEWLSAGPRIAIELHKYISLLGNIPASQSSTNAQR